jgi:prepilin-type N-terminal cleavage/methylation domain-containing protein
MTDSLVLLIVIFMTLLGPAVASFFTAYVYRDLVGDKKYGKRSMCDHCGNTLSAIELVPILSFILQRGKCRKCKENIPAGFFIAELLGLLYFLLFGLGIYKLYLAGTDPASLLIVGGLHFVLMNVFFILAVYDLLSLSIPAKLTYVLAGLGIAVNLIALIVTQLGSEIFSIWGLGELDNLVFAILSGASVFFLVKITRKKESVAETCCCCLFGSYAGLAEYYHCILCHSDTCRCCRYNICMKKKVFRGLQVPLVPFMLLGYIVATFFSTELFDFYCYSMKGFTLLELMVVMGIAAALLALGTVGLISFRNTVQLDQVRSDFISQLRTAQNLAKNSVASAALGGDLSSPRWMATRYF